jgi:hypothetical protein
VSRCVHDLVGGVGDGVTPVGWGGIEEPPSIGSWVLARPLAQAGIKLRISPRLPSVGNLELDGVSPRAPSTGRGHARVSPDLLPEGTCVPYGYSP